MSVEVSRRRSIAIPAAACIALMVLGQTAQGQGVRGVHGSARVTIVRFSDIVAHELTAPPPAKRRFIFKPPAPHPFAVPPQSSAQPLAKNMAVTAPAIAQTTSPSPTIGFEGIGDNDTAIPPDTGGTVGTTHIMTTLNSQVRIQDRSGSPISTVSLANFWSSVLPSGSAFDPDVRFDPFNSRWIFVTDANGQSTSSEFLIGVSQTDDPTGSWNMYKVTCDSAGKNWCDYPSIGFNKTWIVVTFNMFSITGNKFVEGDIYAFNKLKLYAGTSASFTKFADANAFTNNPATTLDNTVTTMYLMENYNGNSNGKGFLRISTITGAVGSETYTAQSQFASTADTWADSGPGAPQQGTTITVDTGDSRLISVIYRNSSLWVSHAVFLPASSPTRSAVQWWNVSPSGSVSQIGRLDDSTATIFYAYPSLAVNKNSDVLIGFSTFSASQFASSSYAFHAAGDAAGTLELPTSYKSGEASYNKTFGGTTNRWGDFSATVVDPTNDLDFWTIQEYAASPKFSNGDDRWGTWWAEVSLSTTSRKRHGQLTSD